MLNSNRRSDKSGAKNSIKQSKFGAKIATDDSMCQMLEIVSNSRSLMLKIATNHPSGQVAAASESKVNLLEPPVTSNGRPSQVDPRPELDVVGRVCRSPSPADVRST